jgi:hypothetical protein
MDYGGAVGVRSNERASWLALGGRFDLLGVGA